MDDKSSTTRLQGDQIVLIPWSENIIEKLAELANNRKIWANLLDLFPHPYYHEHAVGWVQFCNQPKNIGKAFAVCITGAKYTEITGVKESIDENKLYAIGGISTKDPRSPNEKHAVEFGYWIGEPFWGKGIGYEVVKLMTYYVFSSQFTAVNDGVAIERMEAPIFACNIPSGKVLQKNGFILECVEKKRYFKDGKFIDGLIYVKFRS